MRRGSPPAHHRDGRTARAALPARQRNRPVPHGVPVLSAPFLLQARSSPHRPGAMDRQGVHVRRDMRVSGICTKMPNPRGKFSAVRPYFAQSQCCGLRDGGLTTGCFGAVPLAYGRVKAPFFTAIVVKFLTLSVLEDAIFCKVTRSVERPGLRFVTGMPLSDARHAICNFSCTLIVSV